jgi:hypothetical protein
MHSHTSCNAACLSGDDVEVESVLLGAEQATNVVARIVAPSNAKPMRVAVFTVMHFPRLRSKPARTELDKRIVVSANCWWKIVCKITFQIV